MTNEKLEKLRDFKTASFAIWPDPLKNLLTIHGRIVILGLNPSAKISFGENFHKGRFDHWYEEGFSQEPFKGSYMTDLIFENESHASIIVKKWKKDEKFSRKNIRNLIKQFRILEIKKSTPILCIGQNTKRLFSSAFPEYENTFSINHPNSYRMKNNRKVFLKNLGKIRIQFPRSR